MKPISTPLAFSAVLTLLVSWASPVTRTLQPGMQPQVSIDSKGIIRLVFGRNDSIFCATSTDKALSFSASRFIGYVKGMHLGMTRGPQLASSRTASLVTAMDKSGDIHFFQLNHLTNKWVQKGFVNDARSSAPEGLMGIAADEADNFYAVWLDLRGDKQNNIYFSSLAAAETQWSKNRLVYKSPDMHVCECCKPSITVNNKTVAIMFRNWIEGSRDLYVMKSVDKGRSFEMAQKMGVGTWKLKGCPMDGGGLTFDNKGNIQTTWQRQGIIYTAKPGENEVRISAGKGSAIASSAITDRMIISYQDGENVKVVNAKDNKEILSEKGTALKLLLLSNGKVLCVWELNKTVMYRSL